MTLTFSESVFDADFETENHLALSAQIIKILSNKVLYLRKQEYKLLTA